VPTVLSDDGWQHVCGGMAYHGIAVFFGGDGKVTHSGKIASIDARGGAFREDTSNLTSPWEQAALNTSSFATSATKYGKYRCYVKQEYVGCCPRPGTHKIAS
jgi:hypothetical protein